MTRALDVFIGDRRAGTLTCDVRSSSFEYDPAYRTDRNATPLSLSIPLTPGTHPPRVVDPFLWGLLPDNPETLQRWALDARPQADEHNPFSLLEHYGQDCAGAVQFLGVGEEPATGGAIGWLTESQIGAQLGALGTDPNAWTFRDEGRFSLAGAQSKFALARVGSRWGLPAGSAPSTHILKPGIPEYREQALNEHVCVSLARSLGLPAARTELRSFDGHRAIVVERFDRRRTSRGVERVHQEDLCQALAVSPSQKYQDDGGPSISRIVELFRRVQTKDRADATVRRYLLSVAFNWLIAAPDAHAKNYSILLSGQSVALAPLYDIATIVPYENFRLESTKIAQSVNGQYLVSRIGADDWVAEARRAGLDGDSFVASLRDLAAQAPAVITELCSSPDVLGADPEFAVQLSEALVNRVEYARTQL